MPEVFEFQFEPDVLGHIDGALQSYILAGCTCLAGDVFGQYSFDRALMIGSQNHLSQYGGVYDVQGASVQRCRVCQTIYARRIDGSLDEIRTDGFG